MTRRVLSAVALLCASLVSVQAVEPEQGQFNGLIKNSPFGQPGQATSALNGNEAAALEFRGVFADKGDYFFSIHETSTRSSQWVSLKESGQPYVVESYDSALGNIQVRYRNQVMKLVLKRAQIIVQASPVLPAPGPTPVVSTNSTPSDEANRLALVAEEIRRRRALRTPSAQPPVLGASSLPQPQPTPK